MTNITINPKFITVNGLRVGVRFSVGPWVPGIDPATIKIRPSRKTFFPASFHDAFGVENNSDSQTDYFEKDCIRVTPGHAWYAAAKCAADRAV
jgi:hypothetical protein